jgi:hypothetical protein
VVDRVRIPALDEGIEIRQPVVVEKSDAREMDPGVGGKNGTMTGREDQLDRNEHRLDGERRKQQATDPPPSVASQDVDQPPGDEPGEQDHRDRHRGFDEVSDRHQRRQHRECARPRDGDAGKEPAFQFIGEETSRDRIPRSRTGVEAASCRDRPRRDGATSKQSIEDALDETRRPPDRANRTEQHEPDHRPSDPPHHRVGHR